MRALYFGSADRPLLGVYHPPRSRRAQPLAVLLCYPGPHESMQAHWAFRRLAGLLSKAGFPVFRFDYSGTGDSAGELHEASLERWIEDVQTAAEELVELGGTTRLALVGMRLGAALAAQAVSHGLKTHTLVLWEPVVLGARYVVELEGLERTQQARALFPNPPSDEAPESLVGYCLLPPQRRAVREIDLLRAGPFATDRTFLVVSRERADFLRLAEHLAARQPGFLYDFVPESADGEAGEPGAALLSNNVLEAMVARLGGEAP